MNVDGKTVLITGGASGLGAATARAFYRQGAKVAVMDMNLTNAKTVAEEVDGFAVEADITDFQTLKTAFSQLHASLGTLDILVYCAGATLMGPLVSEDIDAVGTNISQSIAVNLTGALHIAALFANQAAVQGPETENGVVIFTASGAAFDGVPGAAAYSAAKGGIVSMTLALARELGTKGIRVNTISPGPMGTPMLAGVPADYVDAIARQTPFPNKPGDPDDFAALVLHICTNAHLNGAIVRLDGGHRTPYP